MAELGGGDEAALLNLVGQFVAAESWAASRRLVDAYPQLLSGAAERALDQLARDAETSGDPRSAHIFTVHRTLLGQCRERGVAPAFDEVVSAGVPEALRERWIAAATASERYQQTGDAADLDPAELELTELVGDPLFSAAPADRRTLMAYALGTVLIDRYMLEAQPNDLDRAIDAFRVATSASAPGDPERPDYLAATGNALGMRHERGGDDADLGTAVAALEEAVRMLNDGDNRLPKFAGELAAILAIRYEATGEAEHIAGAIAAAQRAVRAGEGRPDLPALLNNLVNCLMSRYERAGDLADLWAAVGHAQRAVDLAADVPYRPELLTTLGGVLQLQYDRDRRLDTLDRTIHALDRAASSLPTRSPDRPVCLGNLGNAQLARFERTRLDADLDRAHATFAEALRDIGPDAPRSALLRGGLGLTLLHRHTLHRAGADLRAAIDTLKSAVQAARDAPRIRPFLLMNLASAYRRAYSEIGDAASLSAGVETYRQAYAEGRVTQLELALGASTDWGRWAAERGAWAEASDAFDDAMAAAEQLLRAQFDRADKEIWLGVASGLAARTAYAQARAQRLRPAVATMERGRAQLLAEALRGELAERVPELAGRFRAGNERLRQLRWQPPLWSWSADLDDG